jgi:hypothetical protein
MERREGARGATDGSPPTGLARPAVRLARRTGPPAQRTLGASRRSTAAAICGRRALPDHSTPRSTTPSNEQGAGKIRPDSRAGISFFRERDQDVARSFGMTRSANKPTERSVSESVMSPKLNWPTK